MLVTGVIKEINIDGGSSRNNKYKVEIGLFKIPGDTNSATYNYEANCAVPGGMSALYDVGDKVYIGFLNDDKSLPVILGKIYQGLDFKDRGFANLKDIQVSNNAVLPINCKIGEYSYNDIDKYFKQISLIAERVETSPKATLDTELKTSVAVGGIGVNEDLNGLTALEILQKLLYAYVEATIESVSRTPASIYAEKGTTLAIKSVTAKVNKGSEKIKSISLYNDGNLCAVLDTDNAAVAEGGTFKFENLVGVTFPTATNTLTIKVVDAADKTVEKNTSTVSFVYPYYVGSCPAEVDVNATLVTNTTKVIEAKGAKSKSFTTDNSCMLFAYPQSYGALKSIIDQNNFNITSSFSEHTIKIQCADNTSQNYRVYISEPGTVNNFTVKFNYS